MEEFSSFEEDFDRWWKREGEAVATPRDKPKIQLADGIAAKSGVDPEEEAEFQLALTNESPNGEGRTYRIQSVQASNPGGAVLRANGEPLFQGQNYKIPASNTQEVTLSVERGPSQYDYDSLAVAIYPACGGGDGTVFGGADASAADTVAVSVQYEAPSSPISVFKPENGHALNKATARDSLEVAFEGFSMDTTDTGRRVAEIGLFYRPAKDLVAHSRNASASDSLSAASDSSGAAAAADSSANGRYLGASEARSLFARTDSIRAAREAGGFGAARSDSVSSAGSVSADGGRQGTDALEDWALTVLKVSRKDLLEYHNCPDEECELEKLSGFAGKTLFEDKDDIYELAAYTKSEDPEGNLTGAYVSDPVRMRVDTERPEVLEAPQPADQVLALGDNIKLRFDEPINCETIRSTGDPSLDNVTLSPAEGPKAGDLLPIETSCDGRTIVLKPDASRLDSLEGQLLEARVSGQSVFGANKDSVGTTYDDGGQPLGVVDLADNPVDVNTATHLEEDAVWQFRVRRTAFAWNPVNPTAQTTEDTAATFEAKLTNGTEEKAHYRIEGLAPWLSASIETDELPAGGVRTVRFHAADTLAVGTHRDTLRAVDEANDRATPLFASVEVQAAPPPPPPDCDPPAAWQQPDSLAYTMPIFARYYRPDGSLSTDTSNVVAALVGGEVRGVARIDSVAQNDYRLQLTVASNAVGGETVSFRAFDASACRTYPIRQTVPFSRDSVVTKQGGGPIALDAIDPSQSTSIAVQNGWTWISLNRDLGADTTLSDVFGSLSPDDGAYVKSQTGFAQRASGRWRGSLESVRPGAGYFVRLQQENTLVVQGNPLDPTQTPVELATGWNWIGYLPQRPQPLADALNNLSPVAGDLIKSQTGFAVWTDTDGDTNGDAWLGSLEAMRPGLGYLLKTSAEDAGSFTYPEAPEPEGDASSSGVLARRGQAGGGQAATTARLDSAGTAAADTLANRPNWSVTASRYRYNMSVTARIIVDGEPLTSKASMLAAFRGDSLRGVARLDEESDLGWRAYLMAYGNETDTTRLTLRVYDASRDTVLKANESVIFEPNATIGKATDPLAVSAQAARTSTETLSGVPEEVTLKPNYPNPFQSRTTIPYGVPKAGAVRITVYDVMGRRVRMLVDAGRKEAGWHKVRLQTKGLASGVYFYRLRAGDVTRTRRFVVVQ
jgi:hypothetical protein